MYCYCFVLLTVSIDGPFFVEGAANSSLLKEIQTDFSVNMTCTIKKAVPPVTELTIEPATGDNWNTVADGVRSVTLVIDKANANNTRDFKCIAKNNITSSYLKFNNYVGGELNNQLKVYWLLLMCH